MEKSWKPVWGSVGSVGGFVQRVFMHQCVSVCWGLLIGIKLFSTFVGLFFWCLLEKYWTWTLPCCCSHTLFIAYFCQAATGFSAIKKLYKVPLESGKLKNPQHSPMVFPRCARKKKKHSLTSSNAAFSCTRTTSWHLLKLGHRSLSEWTQLAQPLGEDFKIKVICCSEAHILKYFHLQMEIELGWKKKHTQAQIFLILKSSLKNHLTRSCDPSRVCVSSNCFFYCTYKLHSSLWPLIVFVFHCRVC